MHKGFTLIELLSVFAIIAIMTSLGLAGYTSFNGTQSVNNTTSDVAETLTSAKSRAISQVIPSSCGTRPFVGYEVDISISTSKYTLFADCGTRKILISTSTLPANVRFMSGTTSTIVFAGGTGTVNTVATIKISGYGRTKTISVSKEGSLTIT